MVCHCGLTLSIDCATLEADAIKGFIEGSAVCDDVGGCGSTYTLRAYFEPAEHLRTDGEQVDEDLTGSGERSKRDNELADSGGPDE